jgi:hypothetical protein
LLIKVPEIPEGNLGDVFIARRGKRWHLEKGNSKQGHVAEIY